MSKSKGRVERDNGKPKRKVKKDNDKSKDKDLMKRHKGKSKSKDQINTNQLHCKKIFSKSNRNPC